MKSFKIKKICIQKKTRRAIFLLIIFILLFTISMSVLSIYQSEYQIKENILYSYSQYGYNEFNIHLKNTTVYDTTILKPGEQTIFKKAVEHIQGSFYYSVQGTETADIQLEYQIIAILNTNLWNKEFVILPQQSINTTKDSLWFNETFPINITSYEEIIKNIEEEIEIITDTPTLIIKDFVILTIKTKHGLIKDTYITQTNITFNGNIIEIQDIPPYNKEGAIKTELKMQKQDKTEILWISSTLFFIIVFMILVLISTPVTKKNKNPNKTLKKIMKNNAERIIKITTQPPHNFGSHYIDVETFNDLKKIHQDIGLPILYYKESNFKETRHLFYIVAPQIIYQYGINIEN